ncbi:hypothetical protein IB286_14545 [Spongiibacter sp. KMU-158]|uniref:Uncharacterized protein n=1 Tax=Spongiibacter pelagi TaxID=2760804 RepID=A0A927C5C8_9GAMM|nr:hypothetical protein [Spongiibacter pelagi]MBD2860217.1 hypothetical protein [Spongiibacter pelagi]
MFEIREGRWPPVYEPSDVKDAIRTLSSGKASPDVFYSDELREDQFFQGDVFRLSSGVPLIWHDGQPSVSGHVEYWLLIGNTCDLFRSADDASFTQIVPISQIPSSEVEGRNFSSYQTYGLSRRFYLPPWDSGVEKYLNYADFMRPVTLDKKAFSHNAAQKIASMTQFSWLLLNACLLRFYARDDGRYD